MKDNTFISQGIKEIKYKVYTVNTVQNSAIRLIDWNNGNTYAKKTFHKKILKIFMISTPLSKKSVIKNCRLFMPNTLMGKAEYGSLFGFLYVTIKE